MNDSSNQPYIAPLKAVDPTTRSVLRQVDQVAKALDLRYFVAGAMARDLVLVNVFGFVPGRATRDIDFGIAVENWQQFEALKLKLIEGGEFNAPSREVQRLYWKGQDAAGATPVDIIPFGRIASEDKKIAWPPDRDIVMNVAGFEEALECAIRLQMDVGLIVPVASLPGLTVLKLIAWQDRRHADNRDAKDFFRLLTDYSDAGNLDRIYEQEMPLLEEVAFDTELAGARLLGQDAGRICQEATRLQIRALLASERLLDQLTLQMNQPGEDKQMERISALLKEFSRGFLGRHLDQKIASR